MTAKEKVARQRLNLLAMAEEIGSVKEACKRMKVPRSQYYEFKRAFQTQGLAGLIDRPPVAKRFPNRTPAEVERRVLELSLEHPAWGKARLADELAAAGTRVSPGTVYNIQVRHRLNTRYRRLLALEVKVSGEGLSLTEEQVKMLESLRPVERHVKSLHPGYLLCQDSFLVGVFKGVGRVWLEAVVDSYSSFAFAKLYTERSAQAAADLLTSRVLPFYVGEGVPVARMLTDRGTEFCGLAGQHPYEATLAAWEIEHRMTKVRSPRTNGFVERFNRTVLDEFFRESLRKTFYPTLEGLQRDLDVWIHHYNYERPHRGYRNCGRRPYETFAMAKALIPSDIQSGSEAVLV